MKNEKEAEEKEIEQKRRIRGEKKEKQEKQERTLFDPDGVIKWMTNKKEAHINNELFKKHFNVQTPSFMYRVFYETNDKEKNSELVDIFNSGLKDLKEEIKNMSKEEGEIEKPDEIVEVAEMILKFNKQDQEEKGLKILTPSQMFSRLPITLAQLKAGNNSEKLKNEIRQLLYSLYRSKNMTKQVYNNLINYI